MSFFHNQAQKSWTRDGVGSRGTLYPVDWKPRLYRRMIFDNLKNYLSLQNTTSSQKARYWFEKWTREYPEEVKASTDGYEGTARYAESLAKIIVRTGCRGRQSKTPHRVY